MTTDFLSRFLLWSLGVNYIILIVWFLAVAFFREGIHRLHGRWFDLSKGTFDAIHYGGMAAYKVGIFLFNLAPLIALYLMER